MNIGYILLVIFCVAVVAIGGYLGWEWAEEDAYSERERLKTVAQMEAMRKTGAWVDR